jgi:hypothetical protein
MGQKAREMDKKILNAFLKQDKIEKSLGYRISGSGQPVDSRGVKVNDVSALLPTDYRTALAQDNITRSRVAQQLEKSVSVPGGNTNTRQIYTEEEIRQIDKARQNPDGQILDSNAEVLKAVLEQNKLLTEELRALRKSSQPRARVAPQRIIRQAPKIR